LFLSSIYPTHEELREVTDEYMLEEQEDFLKKYKKDQWQIYYEKNIAQSVSFNNFIKLRQFYICH
jgi:predicted nucleotidyltransferase